MFRAITCLLIIGIFLPVSMVFSDTYYVKNGGNDSAPGLSDANAWATIGKINTVNFSDGDIIYLKRGSTFTDATLTLDSTPAGRNGIVIQDYGSGDLPLLDGNVINPININHALVDLTIKNIDVSGWDFEDGWPRTRILIKDVNGLIIDGVYFDGQANGSNIRGLPAMSEPCIRDVDGHYPDAQYTANALDIQDVGGDITIKNSTWVNMLKTGPFSNSINAWCKNDLVSIHIQDSSGGCTGKISGTINIFNNTFIDIYSDHLHLKGLQTITNIYNNNGNGYGENFIDLKGSSYINMHHNRISGGNIGKDPGVGTFGPGATVFHKWVTCPDLPYKDSTIHNNYFYMTYGDGAHLSGTGHKVYHNYFKDVLLPIRTGSSNTEIFNNVIETTSSVLQDPEGTFSTDSYRSGIYLLRSSAKIYGNTIYVDNNNPSNGITIYNGAVGTEIKNNIIYTTRSTDFPIDWKGFGSAPILSNNLYYNPDSNNRASWNGVIKTTSNMTDLDINAVTSNPLFAGINNSNFALQPGSPAINDGANLGSAYQNGWNPATQMPPNTVQTLNQNSYGANWEIGAYVYTGGAPVNTAPIVNAGSNQSITLPTDTVNLDGTVTDDGLPNPPAAVTTTWTKQSGPGTVTFANANAVDTTASFSAAGTYVLRLTADDTDLQTSDDITITVNGDTTPPAKPEGLTFVE